MKIWLNDRQVEQGACTIDIADRGFLLGDGIFETIAVRNEKIQRLTAHLDRLKQGCLVLGLPFPAQDIEAIISGLLGANGMKDAVVRVTCTRGVDVRGVLPSPDACSTLLITLAPMPAPLPPARCLIAGVTRRNEFSPLARIKSINYLDNILARQEAAGQGFDDALILNTHGRLAEATSSNLFLVIRGRILTPPISEGVLPGIMRSAMLGLAEVEELPITIQVLAEAEEVFLSNCLGLRQVAAIGPEQLFVASTSSVFDRLQRKIASAGT